MAEFALILPLALLILFGIIQFGFLFASQIGMVNALRETVRFASTSPVNDSTTADSTKDEVCNYLLGVDGAMDKMPGYEASFAGPSLVRYESYEDPHAGSATYSVRMTVYSEYRHILLVPLVNVILDGLDGASDGRFRLSAMETMRVENPVLTSNPNLTYEEAC
jgi:Flp pilus assembly protein TadG